MRPVFSLLAFVMVMVPATSYAQLILGQEATMIFATVDEAKAVLTKRDDFVQRMSPFDRAARMKTDRDVSEKEYLAFVGENVLPWDEADKRKITAAFQGVEKQLAALSLPFPKKVFIIKTTGNEEGGAAYTRANAIVIPKDDLAAPIRTIQKTICHELFHILSRANPELRDKLYAAIGFVKCNEIDFPPDLKSRKITNPDAPRNDHCIRLTVGGNSQWVVPILFSSAEKYNVERGGPFFQYLQFQLLLVERNDKSGAVQALYDGRAPKLIGLQQASDFFEQVGKNTAYIIHPEEILADNFALLVLQERNVPSPQIIRKLEEILKDSGRAPK